MAWQPLAVELMEAQRSWGGLWSMRWLPWWMHDWAHRSWQGRVVFRSMALVFWAVSWSPVTAFWRVGMTVADGDEWRHWVRGRRMWRGWGLILLFWVLTASWPGILLPGVVPGLALMTCLACKLL